MTNPFSTGARAHSGQTQDARGEMHAASEADLHDARCASGGGTRLVEVLRSRTW